MEPEIFEFFKRIIKSVFIGIIWLLINTTAGILHGYAFIEDKIKIGNIIFYVWFAVSGFFLYKFLRFIWREKIRFDK
ncbi:hypothetical protein ACI6Q2_05620 [Chitinophagaceae bacterium LWZ2-11]